MGDLPCLCMVTLNDRLNGVLWHSTRLLFHRVLTYTCFLYQADLECRIDAALRDGDTSTAEQLSDQLSQGTVCDDWI